MSQVVYIDGKFLAPEDACVSVFDHGFLFGDSVYEVVRTHHGRLIALDEHLDRLLHSARMLQMTLPSDKRGFAEAIKKTVEKGRNSESYVRLIVSRGTGEIDLHPGSCKKPKTIIIVKPYEKFPGEYYAGGVEVATVGVQRNSRFALNPSIKSGNYLNNVLAIMEAREKGAVEAVMMNAEGNLAECTTSNVFLVSGGRILTPSLGAGILSGITRSFVIRVAREAGYALDETNLPASELDTADEVFITSTLKDVLPVTSLDGKPVGGGRPGPVTRDLMKRFAQFMDTLAAG